MKRTAVRLALAFLLVGSVVANPLGLAALDNADPTGDARAQSGDYRVECSVQNLMAPDGSACRFVNADGHIEDLQDHVAVYTQAKSIDSQSRTLTTVMDNYVLDTQDTGWLIANNETANAYLDGATKAQTKTRVKQAVKQYYTTKQYNLINGWNNHVAALDSMINQSESVGSTTFGTDGQFHAPGWTAYSDGTYTWGGGNVNDIRTDTTTTTALNGSTLQVREVIVEVGPHPTDSSGASGTETIRWNPVDGTRTSAYSATASQINVRPPTSERSVFAYVYRPEWSEPWDKIGSANQEIINESGTFIEQTWLDWEQGNINATDIIAQTNAMNRWQVDSTSESATFNDVVAGLAASGLHLPPLNETGYLNITFRPNDLNGSLTAQGMLLSTAPPPNGTWTVGKTYDTANLSGAQTVVALGSSGNNEQYQVNRTHGILRVNEVYDRDGDKQNVTELESATRDYSVANTTDAQELIINLGEWDKQLEQRQSQDGTGGGDGGDETKQSGLWSQLAQGITGAVSWALGGIASLFGLGGLARRLGQTVLLAIGVGVIALVVLR